VTQVNSIWHVFTHQMATVQQPWRSLRSLSALVDIVIVLILYTVTVIVDYLWTLAVPCYWNNKVFVFVVIVTRWSHAAGWRTRHTETLKRRCRYLTGWTSTPTSRLKRTSWRSSGSKNSSRPGRSASGRRSSRESGRSSKNHIRHQLPRCEFVLSLVVQLNQLLQRRNVKDCYGHLTWLQSRCRETSRYAAWTGRSLLAADSGDDDVTWREPVDWLFHVRTAATWKEARRYRRRMVERQDHQLRRRIWPYVLLHNTVLLLRILSEVCGHGWCEFHFWTCYKLLWQIWFLLSCNTKKHEICRAYSYLALHWCRVFVFL